MFRTRVTREGVRVAARVQAMALEQDERSSQRDAGADQPGVTAPIVGPRTMAHLDDVLWQSPDARLWMKTACCSMHWSTRGMPRLTSGNSNRG